MTYNQLEEKLMEYNSSPVVQTLHDYYRELSFMEILRVERKENYHSNFLKWLFEDPELSAVTIKHLLMLLLKRHRQQCGSHFPKTLKDALLTNSFHLENVRAKLEDSISNDKGNGRCDIMIDISYQTAKKKDCTLHVFIENKTFSEEHKVGKTGKKQTTFYHDHYSSQYGEDNCIFVFLNLVSSLELNEITENKCECEKFIQINYQDLLDNILVHLSNDSTIQQRKQFIINEYIKGLSMNQNNHIMAVDPKMRELLVDFWDNNHELIEAAILALSEDPDLDPEARNAVKSVNTSLSKLKKKQDTTHYKFGKTVYAGKSKLVYAILEHCITKEELTTNKINTEWQTFLDKCKGKVSDFEEEKNWTFHNHKDDFNDNLCCKELKKLKMQGTSLVKDEVTNEHNYSNRQFNNTNYSCYNQWGWANIDFLIKFYRNEIKKGNDPDIEIIY